MVLLVFLASANQRLARRQPFNSNCVIPFVTFPLLVFIIMFKKLRLVAVE